VEDVEDVEEVEVVEQVEEVVVNGPRAAVARPEQAQPERQVESTRLTPRLRREARCAQVAGDLRRTNWWFARSRRGWSDQWQARA